MSDIVTKASVILTIYHLALCVSARSAQELIAEVFIWNSFWHGVMGNPRCFQDSIVFFCQRNELLNYKLATQTNKHDDCF